MAHRNCETGACTRSAFVTNISATGLLERAHVPAPSRAPRSRGKASDQRKGGAFLFSEAREAKGSVTLALIWQPNNAAASCNIYRSASSVGPYTNIVSKVSGASYVDREPLRILPIIPRSVPLQGMVWSAH